MIARLFPYLLLLGMAGLGMLLLDRLEATQHALGQAEAQQGIAQQANQAAQATINDLLGEIALREEWAAERLAREQARAEALAGAYNQLEGLRRDNEALAAQLAMELHPDLDRWLFGPVPNAGEAGAVASPPVHHPPAADPGP